MREAGVKPRPYKRYHRASDKCYDPQLMSFQYQVLEYLHCPGYAKLVSKLGARANSSPNKRKRSARHPNQPTSRRSVAALIAGVRDNPVTICSDADDDPYLPWGHPPKRTKKGTKKKGTKKGTNKHKTKDSTKKSTKDKTKDSKKRKKKGKKQGKKKKKKIEKTDTDLTLEESPKIAGVAVASKYHTCGRLPG